MERNAPSEASPTSDLEKLLGVLRQFDNGIAASADTFDQAAHLMEEIAAHSKVLRDGRAVPRMILPRLLADIGYPPESPFGIAGHALSLAAEQTMELPTYHNPLHITEVIIGAHCLGLRESLPHDRLGELLLAAVSHDLGHTGAINRVPYELETRSFELARPLLEDAGLPEDCIQRIRGMILATDFGNGVRPAREAYLQHQSLPPADPDRLDSAQRLLLTEADILFSCFNNDYNDLLSKLLGVEWDRPGKDLTLKERVGFLNAVTFTSAAARSLLLEQRRLRLRDSLQAQATPPT